MGRSQKHIINKVFIEVHTDSVRAANHLKNTLDVFLKEQALPYLEAYFDELQNELSAQRNLQIEKVTLDLSLDQSLDLDQLKILIKNGVMKELEQKRHANTVSSEERMESKLIHFLKIGNVPWWSRPNALDAVFYDEEMFFSLLKSNEFILELLRSLHQDQFRERLIKQLNDSQVFMLYKSFLGLKTGIDADIGSTTVKNLVNWVKMDEGSSDSVLLMKRYLVWEIALGVLIKIEKVKLKSKLFSLFKLLVNNSKRSTKMGDEAFVDRLSKLIDSENSDKLLRALSSELSMYIEEQNTSISTIKEGSAKKQIRDDNEVFDRKEYSQENELLTNKDALFVQAEEKIIHEPTLNYYVENAGLMLLHPYLKQLLVNCRLLNGNVIAYPEIAVHLLHYIATNQEKQYEYRMAFEKFLCNIPLEQPINRNVTLSADLKLQAKEMVQGVLGNWPEMKNASLQLFRNEYLQRPGKLVLTENNPKVIVERKTQDILLEKLPWNIGLCKLPWKNKIIFTDW